MPEHLDPPASAGQDLPHRRRRDGGRRTCVRPRRRASRFRPATSSRTARPIRTPAGPELAGRCIPVPRETTLEPGSVPSKNQTVRKGRDARRRLAPVAAPERGGPRHGFLADPVGTMPATEGGARTRLHCEGRPEVLCAGKTRADGHRRAACRSSSASSEIPTVMARRPAQEMSARPAATHWKVSNS
jgi:hypothetical protein